MDRSFEFTIEDAEELLAVDVIIHSTDGSSEIHRLYTAEDKVQQVIIDGGDTIQ